MLLLLRMAGAGLLMVGLTLTAGTAPAAAQSDTGAAAAASKVRDPYLVLTGDFFEAMQRLSRAETHTYGDRQEPLLEQIAVASQFMVKTNLTLIKQNERIINLLEELNRKRLLQEK